MAKKNKNLFKDMSLSKEQREKIERRARREADLEFGIKPYGTKIHKNKKKYKREKFSHQDLEY